MAVKKRLKVNDADRIKWTKCHNNAEDRIIFAEIKEELM